MFDKLIETIQQAVKGEIVAGNYFTRPVFLPPLDPKVEPMDVGSLQAVADYVNTEEGNEWAKLINAAGPERIEVLGSLNRTNQRDCYLVCQLSTKQFRFDQYVLAETFIVSLLSQFHETPDRSKLLQVVGNLRDEQVKTQVDDGVTQVATVRTGVARVAEVEVSNPVTLKPIRTFAEVDQPDSPFIFRMRKGNQGVECALFEADGGKWKIEAVNSIKEFLADKVEVPVIG